MYRCVDEWVACVKEECNKVWWWGNVALLPQVGGHTRLLVLNDSTVIKPLNIRELHFYQNIPEDIQNFVPRYKGEQRFNHFTIHLINARYAFYDSLNAS